MRQEAAKRPQARARAKSPLLPLYHSTEEKKALLALSEQLQSQVVDLQDGQVRSFAETAASTVCSRLLDMPVGGGVCIHVEETGSGAS